MTPAEIVAESRARQGLPPKIVDPVAIDKLVSLMLSPVATATSDARSRRARSGVAVGAGGAVALGEER